MREDRFKDWRKPLYECAREHQLSNTVDGLRFAIREYSFLGTYRDSKQQLHICTDDLRSWFLRAKQNVLDAPDYYSIIRACKEIALFEDAGMEEYAGIKKTAREKKQAFALKEQKSQRRKKRVLAGILASAAILTGCFLLYCVKIVQPRMREQAVTMESEGDYKGALEIYRKLLWSPGPIAAEAGEKIPEIRTKAAYCDIEEGSYAQAVDALTELGDAEGISRARIAWGKELREQGLYEEALAQFNSLKGLRISADTEGAAEKRETYYAWSAALVREEDYQNAVLVMERMQMELPDFMKDGAKNGAAAEDETQKNEAAEDETQEDEAAEGKIAEELDRQIRRRLEQLREKRCDAAIAAVIGENGGTVDPEKAFAEGSLLDDLKGQLRFCAALDQSGADLGSIFPDGIPVKDIFLDDYMPTTNNLGMEVQKLEDPGKKALIFSRKEQVNDLSRFLTREMMGSGEAYLPVFGYIPDLNNIDKIKAEETSYQIRLLPGRWQQLPKEYRAMNWDECTLVMLSDMIYLNNGSAKVILTNRFGTGSSKVTYQVNYHYPLFDAVDNVTIYEKNQPDHFLLVDYQRSESKNKSIAIPGYSPIISVTGSPDKIDYEKFWGVSDEAFLEQAAQNGMIFFGLKQGTDDEGNID